LDYIEPGRKQLEDHHVLGNRKTIEKRFGFEPWIVPVHSESSENRECHRQRLQAYADMAAHRLMEASAANPKDFDQVCRSNFQRGYLPACLFLRRRALLNSVEKRSLSEARNHYTYALVAAAGCNLGVEFIDTFPGFIRDALGESDDFHTFEAVVHANAGRIFLAQQVYGQLASKVPRVHGAAGSLYAKVIRMAAFINPTEKNAGEALRIAKESADPIYQVRTSQLAVASAKEVDSKYEEAGEYAVELASDFKLHEPSWWHFIEHQFLLGRTILRSKRTGSRHAIDAALRALIRAQYASAFLNFTGVPVRDYNTASEGTSLARLTPTDVIHRVVGEHEKSFPKERMVEIRREAIFGDSAPPLETQISPVGLQRLVLEVLSSPAPNVTPTKSLAELAQE